MEELHEILRCLESIHLTDPALIPERQAELERLQVFCGELISARRAQIDTSRLDPETRQRPGAIV